MIEAMGLKIIASRSPHEIYQVSIEKLLVEDRHRQIGDLITLLSFFESRLKSGCFC
jgi:hypothetical protein